MYQIKQMLNKLRTSLLFRLSILNIITITFVIILIGIAVYNTACMLVDGMNNLGEQTQEEFENILLQYILFFSIILILVTTFIHYYLTKKLITPIRKLIESTKKINEGYYPEPVEYHSNDEVGQLIKQYNRLIGDLESNDTLRRKMISDLSHEIRTPVTNLNGYLRALEKGDLEGTPSLFHSLTVESDRLKQMIEQLNQLKDLDYSTHQSFNRKEFVDIQSLVEQSVNMMKWQSNVKNIDITVSLEAAEIFLNEEGIQRVFNNLIDNAIRYNIGTNPIYITGKKVDGYYRLSVSGKSMAIDEKDQEKLFERSYRTNRSSDIYQEGNGLGLAIAHEIVAQHGGNIGLEVRGPINEFWFTLPIKKE
ncbi:two-component sensor histidine kinase [Halalkalibacillus sediminis]|uniref:histidine kinase n=1 Tax=Halalkalibacillus sediminis TaxID=2018042 RepID=A0A2I0QWM5_9BACI|nr:ATP-binding protein [Halalkalibacillus sediminis]PKR78718.1 two-component sensor histidine kinase [Halalkalibacillus sediminis]